MPKATFYISSALRRIELISSIVYQQTVGKVHRKDQKKSHIVHITTEWERDCPNVKLETCKRMFFFTVKCLIRHVTVFLGVTEECGRTIKYTVSVLALTVPFEGSRNYI